MSERADKDAMACNKPRRTPGHAKKSHVVKACYDGKQKLIRFGEQGASTAGKPKAGESDRMKTKRASFKARHAKNIAKGPSSPAYWADRVKWNEGGMVKMAAGGSAALALIEQMRRSAAQSPEFDPVQVAMREQRARPARRLAPQAAPRMPEPQAAQPREAPLPLPPVPPAMRPDENPPPEAPRNPTRFDEGNPHVATAIRMAEKYNLPRDIFLSLVQQESRFNPAARSPRGAIGLGQLMPATARELGVDPLDPEQNLEGSARYLRQMLDRFKDMPLALAAYNAGPGRVARAGNTIPNIRETRNYVPSILRRAGANVPEGFAEGGRVSDYDPEAVETLVRSVEDAEGRRVAASLDYETQRFLDLLREANLEVSGGGIFTPIRGGRVVGGGANARVAVPIGREGAVLDLSGAQQGVSASGRGFRSNQSRLTGAGIGYTTPSGGRLSLDYHDRLMGEPDTLPGADPIDLMGRPVPSRGLRLGYRREFAEGGLAELDQKYVEGGAVAAYDPEAVEALVRSIEEPEGYAEGGRVGRIAEALARAFRENLAPRTRQNPRGLPMDEESRRIRAESMGFDLERPLYHGTSADADFRAFRQKDRGVWTGRDPELASSYAKDNDSRGVDRNTASRVIPLVSRAENIRTPSDADMETMRNAQNYARAQAEVFRRMRAQGADAVNMGGGVQVDLDTRNLRSPHATFDPERVREADILAGVGALGAGVGASVAYDSNDLEDLDRKYAEGGAVSDEDAEYDRRLLSRMKAQTGRVTEPTRAEQMQALRTAGRSAAEGVADVLLPQSPLDFALMAALGPGGRAARLAGSAALASLEPSEAEASRLRRLIRAYHGSPYKFEKFDIRKIGTGEGAQVYGRGLYFAENEDIAKYYRDKLAGSRLSAMEDALTNLPENLRQRALSGLYYNNMSPEDVADMLSMTRAGGAVGRDDLLESFRRAAAVETPRGHMYEVDLNASPRDFLNWDAPLSSQAPEVRESLGLRVSGAPTPEETMAVIKEAREAGIPIRDYEPYQMLQQRLNNSREVTLANMGLRPVQGIDPATLRGSELVGALETQLGPEETRLALMRAGIPGTRYLDAGSRGVGGTYNYAVFDPEIIDIRRRYAEGGLAQLEQKYAEGGEVSAMPYNPDAVDALVKEIEAEYV